MSKSRLTTRTLRLRVPFFAFSVTLTRAEFGAYLTVGISIHKLLLHFTICATD